MAIHHLHDEVDQLVGRERVELLLQREMGEIVRGVDPRQEESNDVLAIATAAHRTRALGPGNAVLVQFGFDVVRRGTGPLAFGLEGASFSPGVLNAILVKVPFASLEKALLGPVPNLGARQRERVGGHDGGERKWDETGRRNIAKSDQLRFALGVSF
jgi:hypothetical protein